MKFTGGSHAQCNITLEIVACPFMRFFPALTPCSLRTPCNKDCVIYCCISLSAYQCQRFPVPKRITLLILHRGQDVPRDVSSKRRFSRFASGETLMSKVRVHPRSASRPGGDGGMFSTGADFDREILPAARKCRVLGEDPLAFVTNQSTTRATGHASPRLPRSDRAILL